MAINHGIRVSEAPTRLTSIQEADAALPVYVGAGALWQMYDRGPDGALPEEAFQPVLVNSAEEAYEKIGRWPTDVARQSLLQDAVEAHFTHFGTGPIVLINVLGKAEHFHPVGDEILYEFSAPAAGEGHGLQLAMYDEGLDSFNKSQGGTPLINNVDYTVEKIDGVYTFFTKQGGSLTSGEKVKYHGTAIEPTLLTPADIIGDAIKKTGLQAVPLIYPRYQRVPCILNAAQALTGGGLASENPGVVSALQAASRDINGVFQAVCYTDVGSDEGDYTEIAQAKVDGAHIDSRELVSWGRVKIGDKIYPGSVVMACVTARVDNEKGGGLPYSSPSNFIIPATQIVADNEALELDLEQASDINDLGVNTFIRWGGAYRTWGNRLASNQISGDVKDRFVNVRRMLNWVANTAQISFLAQIDNAGNLATMQTILASVNQWLNGLVASGALLKGEAVFNRDENPDQQLIDGKYKIHIYLTIPTPAESVEFVLEFDPSGFAALFE